MIIIIMTMLLYAFQLVDNNGYMLWGPSPNMDLTQKWQISNLQVVAIVPSVRKSGPLVNVFI